MNAKSIFPVALDYAKATRATSMDLDFFLRTRLGDIRGITADLGTAQVSTVRNNEWHHFFRTSLLLAMTVYNRADRLE